MEISSSVDWAKIEPELREQLRAIGYNSDLYKLKNNIEIMVRELSKKEVEARRTRSSGYLKNDIEKINQSIKTLENWILLAALYKK